MVGTLSVCGGPYTAVFFLPSSVPSIEDFCWTLCLTCWSMAVSSGLSSGWIESSCGMSLLSSNGGEGSPLHEGGWQWYSADHWSSVRECVWTVPPSPSPWGHADWEHWMEGRAHTVHTWGILKTTNQTSHHMTARPAVPEDVRWVTNTARTM